MIAFAVLMMMGTLLLVLIAEWIRRRGQPGTTPLDLHVGKIGMVLTPDSTTQLLIPRTKRRTFKARLPRTRYPAISAA